MLSCPDVVFRLGAVIWLVSPAVAAEPVEMKFLEIPAGEFRMGLTSDDRIRSTHRYSVRPEVKDQKPAHRVRITRPFEVSVHEVTVGQFRAFVLATEYVTDAEKSGGALGFFPNAKDAVERFHVDPKVTWRNPGFEQTELHPVVCVSWNDALAFCKWLSKQQDRPCRLPTEAEWEYLCRAGTDTIYSFGNEPNAAYTYGNVGDGSLEAAHPGTVRYQRAVKLKAEDGDGFVYTAPVGSRKPNPWGLFDLHGNVWEWCSDRYSEQTYEIRLKGLSRQEQKLRVFDDPTGVTTSDQHQYGDWRVIRGGSWFTAPVMTRCGMRAYAEASEATCYTGFRVVRELDRKSAN